MLWLEGRASVEAIEHAIGLVAGRPRRRCLISAGKRGSRRWPRWRAPSGRRPSRIAVRVRVTRLEHASAAAAAVDDGRDSARPRCTPRCTPKQRELLDVIARAGSVTNAAIVLGTTRNNLYATLRRIAHRASLRDSSELLAARSARDTGPPGRDAVPLDASDCRRRLDGRVPVVVGCSGGADSLALLYSRAHAGFDVVAVYVDHGLAFGHRARRARRRRRVPRRVRRGRARRAGRRRRRARTSKPAPRRALRRARARARERSARTRSSSGTRATTRPRPSC